MEKAHLELKEAMEKLHSENNFTSEIDIENDDTFSVGFETKNSYVNIQFDADDSENPYFSTAEDPEIPTANETFHENLDDAISSIKWAIETYG